MEGTRENVFGRLVWLNEPVATRCAHFDCSVNVLSRNMMWCQTCKGAWALFIFSMWPSWTNLPLSGIPSPLTFALQYDPGVKDGEFLSRPGFRGADIELYFKCMIKEMLTKNPICPQLPLLLRWTSAVQRTPNLFNDGTSSPHSLAYPSSITQLVTSRNERLSSLLYDRRVCRRIALETGGSIDPETHEDILRDEF